jgi:hypothetical protein
MGSIFFKKLALLPPFALFVAYAKCSQQLCVGFKIKITQHEKARKKTESWIQIPKPSISSNGHDAGN